MHTIQVQTIGAWKGPQERPGKPCSCHLVNSHAFYKEWAGISMKCVAIVNQKCLFIRFSTIEKHDAYHGAMVWPHHALVKIWEGLAYVVMHTLHKSNHHRGSSMLSRGKSPRLKGNPKFLRSLPWSFFLRRTYTLQITVFKFGIFSGSFTIFRGLCAFGI